MLQNRWWNKGWDEPPPAVTVPLVANLRTVIDAADKAATAVEHASPENAAADYLAVLSDLLQLVLNFGRGDLMLVNSYVTDEALCALAGRILTSETVSQCVRHGLLACLQLLSCLFGVRKASKPLRSAVHP